jgi:N-glycosylase/DNA lyase
VLARVPEKELRACGLGYRAPYLKAAAQMASGTLDLEKLKRLDDDGLREALMTIPGIGEKVVECVMLFGYGRDSAFPVDVWIARSMRRWYFRNRKTPDATIRAFARKHFGPRCGWAQQYLFHYSRAIGRQGIELSSTSRTRRG